MQFKSQTLDRRRLLSGIGALGGATLFSRSAFALPRGDDDRVLILVQLSGGNDGLSTVVPHGDDVYHAARRSTRVTSDDVLRIDDYRGLNPELIRLHARYKDGGLAIIEGVGYEQPNRSHFKSLEVWHTADRRGRNAGDGWIGGLCEAEFGRDAAPNRVVHIGPKVPYSVHSSSHPAAAFTTPAGYRWVKNEENLAELDRDGGPKNESLAFLRRKMRDARASSAALRAAVVRYRTRVEYPNDAFGDDLRATAALVSSDLGTRVISVELSGFDTHNAQRSRHQTLMRTLDAGLSALLDDLDGSEVGRRAIVVVFSEFGRRVAENNSGGTDHGCAGPMFVAGARVEGGLHGEHPSLTELDDGDLVYTTDFRSVYAEAIRACFETAPDAILGGSYPRLGLLG